MSDLGTHTNHSKNTMALGHDSFNDMSSVGGDGDHDDDDDRSSSAEESATVAGDGIARKENRWVIQAKVCVVLVLIGAAVVVSYAVLGFTSGQQEQGFETRFKDSAGQINAAITSNGKNIFGAFRSMSVQVTSLALGMGQTFPFVTIPRFEAQGKAIAEQTGAILVGFMPVIRADQHDEWINYTQTNGLNHVKESLRLSGSDADPMPITEYLWDISDSRRETQVTKSSNDKFCPGWMYYPAETFNYLINYDGFSWELFSRTFARMSSVQDAVLSEVTNLGAQVSDIPQSFMSVPVFDDVEGEKHIAAALTAIIPWDRHLQNVLPDDVNDVIVVVRNTCEQVFSFRIDGPTVHYLGLGDRHDSKYDRFEEVSDFTSFSSTSECVFSLHMFPTNEFSELYINKSPKIYAGSVLAIFLVAITVFVVYDCLVERRQERVVNTANQTHAIVSSLFPANVRDRLIQNIEDKKIQAQEGLPFGRSQHSVGIDRHDQVDHLPTSPPIADLFLNASVLFADIAGFTAWSSEREPTQVFTLLETVYNSFDRIARRLKVFKVETIGDCYVAATGLPVPRDDHAIALSKFAIECLSRMKNILLALEITLGPGTSDLAMRFGIHSGSVTAGVLRGEKSRFQLFGDTVNTAARMESTGLKNRIQISEETAMLLENAGKSRWIRPRETKINAKGKGELRTFWLFAGGTSSSVHSRDSSDNSDLDCLPMSHIGRISSHPEMAADSSHGVLFQRNHAVSNLDDRQKRLAYWNIEMLQKQLKKIVAMRSLAPMSSGSVKEIGGLVLNSPDGHIALDEVRETIDLPKEASTYKQDPANVQLDLKVIEQLTSYVMCIAAMYKDNPFHSFEHASHVTQSVTKLLSRIVSPESRMDYQRNSNVPIQSSDELHDSTFGITSDPLTQFAVTLAALVHDVDHSGVPNNRLLTEQSEISAYYRNKSVAEQNSIDLAWSMLFEPEYIDLRACIYQTQEELERFRQLVVNSVMATDIVDQELGAARKERWAKAFALDADHVSSESNDLLDRNRKATIVIEHLIQASDVAHTMQHWHVYVKWNEKLFHEMYRAYRNGRSSTDPSIGWYKGELGFFDYYIIPLAKKLHECGVFGVSSDEYTTYALQNRAEWERKGESIVRKYLESYEDEAEGSK